MFGQVDVANCLFFTSFRLARVPGKILDILSKELTNIFEKIDTVKFQK